MARAQIIRVVVLVTTPDTYTDEQNEALIDKYKDPLMRVVFNAAHDLIAPHTNHTNHIDFEHAVSIVVTED